MKFPTLRPTTYAVLCALTCAAPLGFVFVRILLSGGGVDSSAAEDHLLALAGTVGASLLTYPAGFVATAMSLWVAQAHVLTATEAVLLAAPIYILAGYLQWYVVIPRYFSR